MVRFMMMDGIDRVVDYLRGRDSYRSVGVVDGGRVLNNEILTEIKTDERGRVPLLSYRV